MSNEIEDELRIAMTGESGSSDDKRFDYGTREWEEQFIEGMMSAVGQVMKEYVTGQIAKVSAEIHELRSEVRQLREAQKR